jgi:hypothetical protein
MAAISDDDIASIREALPRLLALVLANLDERLAGAGQPCFRGLSIIAEAADPVSGRAVGTFACVFAAQDGDASVLIRDALRDARDARDAHKPVLEPEVRAKLH